MRSISAEEQRVAGCQPRPAIAGLDDQQSADDGQVLEGVARVRAGVPMHGANLWPAGASFKLPLDRTSKWLNAGVQVRASNSEVKSETVMVTASARKKVPVTPVMEMSGRKTTMGVMVEPMSGTVSSFSAL